MSEKKKWCNSQQSVTQGLFHARSASHHVVLYRWYAVDAAKSGWTS